MCVSAWNVSVVRRWVEVASLEEIDEAIDIPSSIGTALCMAAAPKKDHETGTQDCFRCIFVNPASFH